MKNSIRKLVLSALLTALCVVIGWVCKAYFTFGAIRITFENLPILLAGFLLGPVYGAAAGAAADIVSALLTGFSINPVITLGAASIGAVAGVLSKYLIKKNGFLQILIISLSSHALGSMIIKSLGLWMYDYAWQLLLLRVPLYIVIGTAEAYIIYIMLNNSQLASIAKGTNR